MPVAAPASVNDEIVAAIEAEHEPLYSDGIEVFLESVVVALGRRAVLVGRTRKGALVCAYAGIVRIDGRLVELSLNPLDGSTPPRALGASYEDRRRRWFPHVRLPGDSFDAAYVFVALLGCQEAGRIADAALGCEDCARGLVDVETTGSRPLRVLCTCQGYEAWDDADEVPFSDADEARGAREEPGAWFSGRDLGVRRGQAQRRMVGAERRA